MSKKTKTTMTNAAGWLMTAVVATATICVANALAARADAMANSVSIFQWVALGILIAVSIGFGTVMAYETFLKNGDAILPEKGSEAKITTTH